jgi:hypothetical protein
MEPAPVDDDPSPSLSPNPNLDPSPSPNSSRSDVEGVCGAGDGDGVTGRGEGEPEAEPDPFYVDESEEEQMGGSLMAGSCSDHIKAFARMRVDWKSSDKALKPGRLVDEMYWPDCKVSAPNPTFFNGPYHRRATIWFWAPSIFWPWYVVI